MQTKQLIWDVFLFLWGRVVSGALEDERGNLASKQPKSCLYICKRTTLTIIIYIYHNGAKNTLLHFSSKLKSEGKG